MNAAVIDAPPLDAPERGRAARSAPWVPHTRLGRFIRGRPSDPVWVRPALLALLVGTGFLYLWDLAASGWANSFYSAAVQAGTKSWKAFFFGSFDSSSFITVDKAPAALWVMELSARLFGVNAWSILVPNALEGVATVAVLYATVRRWFAPGAALLAGAVMALTPVAALMFRFNNPDAFMVLLLTLAAYAVVRAVEGGRTRWLVLAGSLVGFAFLAKMLQAFLVMPAFVLVYAVAGPGRLGRRIRQLVYGGLALLVAAGWWVLAVQLTPAADRPYIGGSQNNSLWNLIFGYNGFGRLTGNEAGSVGGGGGGSRWGVTGLTRLFGADMGSQISWLLPAALVLLVAGLVWSRGAPRRDRTRAALLMWGGWLVVTGLVFSFGRGIIHPYYTVALAPAIGALVGVGGLAASRRRQDIAGRSVLSGAVAATAVWAWMLMRRSPAWMPELRGMILVGGLAAAAGLAGWPWLDRWGRRAVVVVALATSLAAPVAYTLDTVATPHSGAIPSAGPAVVASSRFGPGGLGGPGGRGTFGATGGPPGGFPGQTNGGASAGGPPAGNGLPGGGGPAGGLLNASQPGAALVRYLENGAHGYRWALATVGANEAAGYQLATGDAVMAIGGFNGSDPAPTLTEFQRLVAAGDIHYFIAGGAGGAGGGPAGSGAASTGSEITSWVEAHYPSTTVDGVTVYNLATAGG
jgi:4-amino-4-deoxy-L-arabinose transferase-like glycosyltransferase